MLEQSASVRSRLVVAPSWTAARSWLTAGSLTALARLVVFVLPVAFVVVSWLAGGGFPYYVDNNETFLVYAEARNLEIWNPNEYGWLAATSTDPALPRVDRMYTHMPNGPRYLHYLLLKAGLRDMPSQTLVLGLLATILTLALAWRLVGRPGLLVVPLALALDYPGFLAWTVNTNRVWIFVVYFGMALAVTRHRPVWAGLVAFVAFQQDIGVAVFVGAMAAALALLVHGRKALPWIVAVGAGTALSAAIFLIQVLSYLGWDGFVAELAATYARRGMEHGSAGLASFLARAVLGPFLLAVAVAGETYNRVVSLILVSGVIAAPMLLWRGRLSEPHRLLARLLVATTFGTVVLSTLLYGYFVDAFIFSGLPFATLLIAPAIGLVTLEARRLLARRWSGPAVGAICGGLVLLPLVVASVGQYRPPVAADLFRLLASEEYQGRSIVGPGITPELAFSLTGGRAASTGGLGSSAGFPSLAADPRYLDSLRDADGLLTYVCLDPVYQRHATNPLFADCGALLAEMAPQIRGTVVTGDGWTIVRFEPARVGAPSTVDRTLP